MTNSLYGVVTSRVRLARNLSGYKFKTKISQRESKEIIDKVAAAASRYADFKLQRMADLSEDEGMRLKESYVISEALRQNPMGAVLIGPKDMSIMINEEDHLREQCMVKGLNLIKAYSDIAKLDGALDKSLNFVRRKDLGYVTACPTNLGTGLRASAMVFLPALTKTAKAEEIFDEARREGIAVRGVFGEGSKDESFLYQISNDITLGRDPVHILQYVENCVKKIIEEEHNTARVYYNANKIQIEDDTGRAFGILTNCKILSYSEFSSLISDIKFGATLGVIKVRDIGYLDDLLVMLRPALFMQKTCSQTAFETDKARAAYVSSCLRKIII